MSRLAKNTTLALAALTIAALSTPADAGCGSKGGGHRTSGRLSIAYNRNVPHMRSHAPQPSRHHNNYHAPRHQPVRQHAAPVYHPQPVVSPVVPAFQPAPIQPAPIAQPAIAPQPAVIPSQAAPAATPEQSALDALAAFTGGAVEPNTQPHLGSWNASVASSQVTLTLNADGTFRWAADASGKASSFEGTYQLADGRLTLTRADRQTLAGSWSVENAGGARFRLAGATDAGLLFTRG